MHMQMPMIHFPHYPLTRVQRLLLLRPSILHNRSIIVINILALVNKVHPLKELEDFVDQTSVNVSK
jgi:hypothetical protein